MVAIFGVYRLDDPFEVERTVIRPEKIIIHEEWDTMIDSYDADIALLKFEEGKININHAYINPICIWDSIDDPLANEGVILGWGQSKHSKKRHETIPKRTKVTIYYNEECLLKKRVIHQLASNRTFSANNQNVSGTCTGDSGGGLFIKVDGIFYLKGLLSAGIVDPFGECSPASDISEYSIYTNIQKLAGWMKRKTQGALATSAKGKLLIVFKLEKMHFSMLKYETFPISVETK